jgi:hypothetical protein
MVTVVDFSYLQMEIGYRLFHELLTGIVVAASENPFDDNKTWDFLARSTILKLTPS